MTKLIGVAALVVLLLVGSQARGRRAHDAVEPIPLSYPAGSDYFYDLDSRWVVGEAIVHSYGQREGAWLLRLHIDELGDATFELTADGSVRDLTFSDHAPASARFVLGEIVRVFDVRDAHGVVIDARGHLRRAANPDTQLRLVRIHRS